MEFMVNNQPGKRFQGLLESLPFLPVNISNDQPHPFESQTIMEIRKRENPGYDICVALSQADQERKKEALPPLYMLWKLISSDKIYNAVYLRSQLNESEWVIFQSNVY